MSVENQSGDYAFTAEIVPTVQDIRFMSENIIDSMGTLRQGDHGALFDAEWSDDTIGLDFILQKRRQNGRSRAFRYDLYVTKQFSSDGRFQRFMYDTKTKDIAIFNEEYVITGQRTEQERITDLANYLEMAPVGTTEKDDDFNAIIALSDFEDDPLRSKKLRYIARRIIDRL